jgi:malyl-CoA/(S)-citramalyl-CoA lyase
MSNLTRPERSLLSVPASSERFFAKAAASAADTIMLDLEDGVAPDQKDTARISAMRAVDALDWGGKTLLLRVNGLDTPWAYRDLIAAAEGSRRLDGVMVPKVNAPRDVQFVETLLAQVEAATGRARPLTIEVLVETALGLTQVEAIAAASPRLEAISFGPGDFAADMGTRGRRVGGPDPGYAVLTDPDAAGRRELHWGDAWHHALARIAVACRAHGLRPVDGVYVDFQDAEGFRAAARRSRALGFEGKWCIHPTQVPLANAVYGPTAEEVEWARGLLAAMEQAHGTGAGAIGLGGQMVDMAHVRQARRILAQAAGQEPQAAGPGKSGPAQAP